MAKKARFSLVSAGLRGTPWRINIPASLSASGKRERHFFATKVKAETFAKNEQTRITNFGVTETNLTAGEREAAASALRLLGEGSPQRLVEIVEQHLTREKVREASIGFGRLETEFKKSKKSRSAAFASARLGNPASRISFSGTSSRAWRRGATAQYTHIVVELTWIFPPYPC